MRLTVARAMTALLEAAGTEHCFGYNGHGNWALLDAFVHETSIETIAARSEDQAVHMADCYWRTRRRPPMAVVTTSVGPGNANITPAVAQAFFESSALLVLAGGGATQWYERGGIEEYYRYGPDEWVQTLKASTKKAFVLSRPDTALEMLMRAYKTAISGRPGPVVVQIPFDIQSTEIEVGDISDPWRLTRVSRPGPDPSAIAAAADLLSGAQRPVVVVSSGVHNAQAWDDLAELADRFDLPVETTTPGKGALPEDHRLSLGCVGRSGTAQANQAARECDVLVGIGTRFGDIDTGGWTLHDIPGATKLIHIDIDDGELARVYPTDVAIVSDAKLGIRALIEAMGAREQAARTEWLAHLDRLAAEFRAETEPSRRDDALPMGYARVFTEVSDVINEVAPQATVLFDTGHALSFGPAFLRAQTRHFIHCGFFHRMGWSVPGAVGARLARPDEPAVVLVGDGSFVMAGAAVSTAVERRLPIVFVVLNNATLQIERELMLRNYGRHALTDYVRVDTGAPQNPDFAAWAEAMGADGVRITAADELGPAIREALAKHDQPTVIDVPIDPDSPGFRSIHYPYPSDFSERGVPNPTL